LEIDFLARLSDFLAKSTKNAPRTPRDPPKIHFIAPRKVTKWAPKITREKWERLRESGERFWHNRVVVKNLCQNEDEGLPFK
jgi:hypothetical protein